MRLSAPRVTANAGWTRLTATAVTERSSVDLYFEVPERHGSYLAEGLDGFLPAVASLAPLFNENLIEVDEVDPDLLEGTRNALAYLGLWYPSEYGGLRVTSQGVSEPISTTRSAASLLTGGIDSLATLRRNHLMHPPGHPLRITTGILVNFYAGSGIPHIQQQEARYMALGKRLETFGEGNGMEIVQLKTNLTALVGYEEWPGWGKARHGMFFAGAAHALSGGVSTVRIASSFVLGVASARFPWGSHPLIDNELWSASMRMIHDGSTLTRTQKTALVAEWPEALNVLNVCTRPGATDRWNCGVCEKCTRTAAALIVAGNTEAAVGLRGGRLSASEVRSLPIRSPSAARLWVDIAGAADQAGIHWLSDAARHAVRRYRLRRPVGAAVRPLLTSVRDFRR